MEKKFTVSVDTAREWLERLTADKGAPVVLSMILAVVRSLKNKKLEIIVRAVDE